MKFKFRLQRVLEFLTMRETAKKVEVAAAARLLADLEVSKNKVLRSLQEVLDAGNQQTIDLAWHPFRSAKTTIDVKQVSELEKRIGEAKTLLEQKQFQLAQVALRRKALDNLKEKKHVEFRMTEGRKDQKRLDELYQLNKLRFRA